MYIMRCSESFRHLEEMWQFCLVLMHHDVVSIHIDICIVFSSMTSYQQSSRITSMLLDQVRVKSKSTFCCAESMHAAQHWHGSCSAWSMVRIMDLWLVYRMSMPRHASPEAARRDKNKTNRYGTCGHSGPCIISCSVH